MRRLTKAEDMELATRGQVFVGNGFSTFTSTVYVFQLGREATLRLTRSRVTEYLYVLREICLQNTSASGDIPTPVCFLSCSSS